MSDNGEVHNVAESLEHMLVPLDDLREDPENARRHDERNIDAIKRSLARWGQRQPIVVQEETGIVRAGNGRLIAMRALGWTHAAVLMVDEDDADAKAYAIADNRTGELAEWDYGRLADEFAAVAPEDIPDLGFTPEEVQAISLTAPWLNEKEPDAFTDETRTSYTFIKVKVEKEAVGKAREMLAKMTVDLGGKAQIVS